MLKSFMHRERQPMNLQYLCHMPPLILSILGFAAFTFAAEPGTSNLPAHDYPTLARVEYVNECIGKNGGKLAALYQCSCAIDRIANAMTYDDYVEASTYAKYATLPGEGGGIFRDSDTAKKLAKTYRELESNAQRGCGLTH
jgi:hypothetical protein